MKLTKSTQHCNIHVQLKLPNHTHKIQRLHFNLGLGGSHNLKLMILLRKWRFGKTQVRHFVPRPVARREASSNRSSWHCVFHWLSNFQSLLPVDQDLRGSEYLVCWFLFPLNHTSAGWGMCATNGSTNLSKWTISKDWFGSLNIQSWARLPVAHDQPKTRR